MAKQFTNLNKNYAQHIADFNILVNKVGDLVNLNTSEDSDLVGAINAVLTEGGVDSAAIVAILDSGQYLAFPNLTATADSDFVLVFGNQTINGIKKFGAQLVARAGIIIDAETTGDTPTLSMQDRDRLDSSQLFRIVHADSATRFQWTDSTGGAAFTVNVIEILNDTADNAIPGSVLFRLGDNNGIIEASIDSATEVSGTTLMTRTKADARYLLDSATVGAANIIDGQVGTLELADSAVTTPKLDKDAVTTNKLADSAVTTPKLDKDAVTRAKLFNEIELIIYDSTGSPLKTLYGAGP